ncbi:RpiR family transcriptional regulator [Jeongeupia sp. HS-3]|uniref:MurR/RpiR family transcriptional regulator n=1 Tax=Jeongeupia sp. HS-3 TaxID=1009682 RepID=UPI0018A63B37|nr:MurR/RpiR family transcriptional regulator [Jeongeupia sp. HS-3]BCL77368.1 RpiR family transcriptional regulator [Jeongeupia sp. HS-3]
MNKPFDIVYQLRSALDTLSPTERKVADAILADVTYAAGAGIEQLATRAGVSMATISRFAKAVGCDDIRELRVRLAQAGAVGSRFLAPAEQAEPSAFYAQICGEIEQTLHANLARFDPAAFGAAVDALQPARQVFAFGVGGGSTMLAQELQFRLVRLGRAVTAYSDAVMMKIVAATLSPDDVLLLLSVSGITPEILAAAEIARAYGARVIAITAAGSPLAALADVLLPITTSETDFIFKPSASRYAMMFAIDLLATEYALRQSAHSKEMLRRVKYALDEYRGGDNRLPLGD